LNDITPVVVPDPEPPALPTPSLPFRRPADYYSSPVGDARPLFPRWVPYGCGSAAIVALIIVFGVGVAVSRGMLGQIFDLMFATTQAEIDKMFTRDVKPADKQAFDAEMKNMRDLVRNNRVSIDRLQPLLRMIREAISDERVTPAETQQLTQEIREINHPAKK
jgi:hypothetical protein